MGEWRHSYTYFFTLALDGGEDHALAALPPGTRWIGGWVGPRSVMDAVVNVLSRVLGLSPEG